MTTLDGKTSTGTLSIVAEAGALPALELMGVKGLLMIELMMFPTGVVVGDWPAGGGVLLILITGGGLLVLTTGGGLLVLTTGGGLLVLTTGGGSLVPTSELGEAEPPPTLAFGVVVVLGFLVVDGIWNTGGLEVSGTMTGTGVFLVTNTVLVKADPVEAGAGGSVAAGASVLTIPGAKVDAEPKAAVFDSNDALGEKGTVTTVRAGWKVSPAVDEAADPGQQTPTTQAGSLDDAASGVNAAGIIVAAQATGGVMVIAGGSDALLAETVTRNDSVIVAYTVGGTESKYVTEPTQLGWLVVVDADVFWKNV